VVVVVLTARRRHGPGPLARTLAEYALVALLAVLLATAGTGQTPAQHAEDRARRQPSAERPADRPPAERADAGADRRPGIVRLVTGVRDWLAEQWDTANQQAGRSAPPPSTTTPKEGT
jgi:hypothetical protein